MAMKRALWLLSCGLATSGCALGLGANSSADPRAETGGVGVAVGAAPGYTRVAPDGLPAAATYGWKFHGGVTALYHGFGAELEYEHRYEEGDYAGKFGTMLRSRAVTLYGLWSPIRGLGFDVGVGYIGSGLFGFGGRGNVVSDTAAGTTSADATGVRGSLRLNWQLVAAGEFGTDTVVVKDRYTGATMAGTSVNLPVSTTLQLEVSRALVHVEPGPGLPTSAQTTSVTAALVFAVF